MILLYAGVLSFWYTTYLHEISSILGNWGGGGLKLHPVVSQVHPQASVPVTSLSEPAESLVANQG